MPPLRVDSSPLKECWPRKPRLVRLLIVVEITLQSPPVPHGMQSASNLMELMRSRSRFGTEYLAPRRGLS